MMGDFTIFYWNGICNGYLRDSANGGDEVMHSVRIGAVQIVARANQNSAGLWTPAITLYLQGEPQLKFDGNATFQTQELAERHALQLGTQWVSPVHFNEKDLQ